MANKSINDLPEGMISEILLRLPVKSLLQCKSVCKPWLSLISTPHFVQSQLLRAIMASMNTPTLLCIEKPPLTEEELARKLAFEATAAEMDTHIVTLFSDPTLEQQQQRRRQLVDEALLDAATQDLSSCPVYSSTADSWTSEFKAPILKNVEYYGRTNVVVDGVLYFDDNKDHLISFDLHNEIFGLVPIPSLTRMGSDVLDFQGSVAMVFQSGFEIYDLWTLDNVSGDVSWTKKFSIEAHPETEIWLTKYLGAAQFFGKKLFDRSVFMFNVLRHLNSLHQKQSREYRMLTIIMPSEV
ncbi:hypothetical protein ACET3Z_019144 [Daucus carota]